MATVVEELLDVPLYVDTHNISKTLKCTPPKHEMFRSALVNAGMRNPMSQVHMPMVESFASCRHTLPGAC